MNWHMAMRLAFSLNRMGWKARVYGKKNMNGVWIYHARYVPNR